jgi:hypothetical protein
LFRRSVAILFSVLAGLAICSSALGENVGGNGGNGGNAPVIINGGTIYLMPRGGAGGDGGSAAVPPGHGGVSPAVGRLPTSFRWYYQFQPKGWRLWTRVDDTTWVEKYDSGQSDTFSDRGLGEVNGCRGLLLMKDNNTLQAFVPDDRCANRTALFQVVGPNGPQGVWNALGPMQNIVY